MNRMNLIATRIPQQFQKSILNSQNTSRLLTTSTLNAVDKLKAAVNEYRIKNDPQELPSRVKKDILHAADFDHNGQVTAEGLQRIVQNIGAQHSVSKEDVHLIVLELGNQENTGSKDSVSVNTLLRVL
ncbi:hypothetical protein CTEN210_12754 [Chaetoceros tenuissimus]|uniref:Uncharacterized protein n=1 Tax=Chaetoceros tenuissimus TaxID=426638 RepID=A0AAD3D261_9STRA|nr:hypothetical protein CTEN210_12754 [Chaetoceros tenuissimus]